MKENTRFVILTVLMLAALALSACGPSLTASSGGGGKVEASMVEFTGQIEAMNGDQWTISGQTITVDPAVVRGGPFAVGDTVKIQAQVAADGSLTVTGVDVPQASAGDSNSNDVNTNDDNSNDANTNDNNSNDVNSNDNNSNDDNSNSSDSGGQEVYGVVESINGDQWTINGVVYTVADFSEIKDQIAVGDFVKIHVIVNADGTLTIREAERSSPDAVNSNDDNSNDENSNDDNSNDDNSNDDNSNDDDSNSNNNDDDSDSNSNSNDDDDDDSNGNGS